MAGIPLGTMVSVSYSVGLIGICHIEEVGLIGTCHIVWREDGWDSPGNYGFGKLDSYSL
jgi:hypothetical protein